MSHKSLAELRGVRRQEVLVYSETSLTDLLNRRRKYQKSDNSSVGVTPESQPCHLRNGSEDASDIGVQYIRAMLRKYVSTSLDLSLKAVHTGLESSIGGGLVVEGVGVGEISTQTGGLLIRRLVLALSTQESRSHGRGVSNCWPRDSDTMFVQSLSQYCHNRNFTDSLNWT
jgi:hypothetical protein